MDFSKCNGGHLLTTLNKSIVVKTTWYEIEIWVMVNGNKGLEDKDVHLLSLLKGALFEHPFTTKFNLLGWEVE
jgi:hypothetical protein